MNKYYLQPVLFNSFLTGNSFLKKITFIFSFVLLFCFSNSGSAQWIGYSTPIATNLYDMSFINSTTGWGISNVERKVIKTTNGGVNWTTIAMFGNPIYNVHFLNETTGFIGGTGVFKTTNGGINWAMSLAPVDGVFEGLDFIDFNTGWAADAVGKVHKTTNCGASWTQQTSGISSELICIDFIDANTGWICGINGIVIKTTNGGTNWQTLATGTTATLEAISFSDSQKGIVTGQSSTALRTTNGGVNWITIPGFNFDIYGAYYMPNTSIAWIAELNIIYYSTNDGINWTMQTVASPNLISISFISTSIGYAGGANGTAYITKTGGFNLAAPSNLTATAVSSSQINLSWTDNSQEDKFIIERHVSGNWIPIDSVNAGITSYQSTGLLANQEYRYRVYAKNLYWRGDNSSEVAKKTLIETPVNEQPANNEIVYSDTVVFEWETSEIIMTCTLQVATDSLFSNIVHSMNEVGFNIGHDTLLPGVLQNSTKYFWRVRLESFGNYSNYSTPTSFIYQNANYGNNRQTGSNLYYFANSTPGANPSPSKPSYNWRDTTGSINIILNTVAQMPAGAGTVDDGRFDILGQLPTGNSMRFFGTNYTNFYVGTNGIVAFAPFAPTGTTQFEPTAPLPQSFITNAIFPLWKDLNFGDFNIPLNRLCYKITSDEVIITYMRVANFVQTGASFTDYVSFQVIIKHSASPIANSKIEVMYNYDETGSIFRNKYNNNTLANHLIGIEGANNSAQILQYRYRNASSEIISSGPMFGSNLALAMGPDVNALPVELASFTSTVNRNNVELNWSTISEENNSGFDVERLELSNVRGEWKRVGNVQGNGTTSQIKNYSYEDRNVQSGNYKYRLKQIDYNGNFEYHELSGEVNVGVPNKFALSQNYPNPFNPVTKINFEVPNNSKVVLQVYDVTGRMILELVNKQMEAGYYTIGFNGANFANGVYFYRLVANDFVETKKMLLVK